MAVLLVSPEGEHAEVAHRWLERRSEQVGGQLPDILYRTLKTKSVRGRTGPARSILQSRFSIFWREPKGYWRATVDAFRTFLADQQSNRQSSNPSNPFLIR